MPFGWPTAAARFGTAAGPAHCSGMTELPDDPRAADRNADGQVARLDLSFGSAKVKVRVHVTPAGLLAIGGLVSSILLSTAALVWVATSAARRHPIASRLPLR
jgi:hypothetical protein